MGFLSNEKPTAEERETYVMQLAEHFTRINLLGSVEGTPEDQAVWMQARHEARTSPEGMDVISARYKKRFGSRQEKSAWREAFDFHIAGEEN